MTMAKTITLDAQEEAAFRELLDIALKSNGMGAMDVVTHFLRKLAQAGQPAAEKIKAAS